MNEIGEIHLTIISKNKEDIKAIQKALTMTNLEFCVSRIKSFYGVPVVQTIKQGIL